MSKLQWDPWHEVVKLRPDVKSGELTLNVFVPSRLLKKDRFSFDYHVE